MKKLPIGIQTFSKLIENNCVYVDKTEQICALVQENSYYFLSRPRRFGKSLLISTLKELFLGNKELFKDLWIGKSDKWDWQKYPVLHLDFSGMNNKTTDDLEFSLRNRLIDFAQENGIIIGENLPLHEVVEYVFKKIGEKNRIVLLIDEYDYPILQHLKNIQEAKAQQAILRSFYAKIKSLDPYIHFVFLTGVTKFSKTSIFSGLNNLKDITNTLPGASLLGYTHNELEYFFKEHIGHVAQQEKMSFEDIVQCIKKWYNGYRFTMKNVHVYNPFSVLLYLSYGEFGNYWFETGTPSFLVEEIRKNYKDMQKLTAGKLDVSTLDAFEIENISVVPLLFQTGYLTIKAFDPVTRQYTLGFPNYEVELAFEKHLLKVLTYSDVADISSLVKAMMKTLCDQDLDEFCDQLKSLFANIPYHLHIKQEKYYHSLFQMIGTLLGMEMQSEIATDKGRIDMTLIMPDYVYIFEYKFNEDPHVALEQIEHKKYYEKYLHLKKKQIILVGVAFKREDGDLDIEYVWKVLKK